MVLLGAFVYTQAPQLLSASNLTQVTAHASIIAVAAVGQAIVVITRNVDLSVEAIIGLVAFAVADLMATNTLDAPAAVAAGMLLGPRARDRERRPRGHLAGPAIIATLGTLSAYTRARPCSSRAASR